ncbi:MAG: class I SAM-dependent methyltransferase [Chloroflexi bacterium]|nr:class I SAM-dependent methyltransferase [Chloroflexota bacterium]
MRRLEAEDARDRVDGTPRARRLRAIQPEVGEFLLAIATAVAARTIVEVGTSAGYSTLWLALAAERTGGRVTTFEVDPAKVAIAARNLAEAGLSHRVDSRLEDGLAGLQRTAAQADLVFIDAEKEDYESFLEPAVRALRPGGTLVADNLTSHAEDLAGFRAKALGHPHLSGLVVPIGRGELLAVKID